MKNGDLRGIGRRCMAAAGLLALVACSERSPGQQESRPSTVTDLVKSSTISVTIGGGFLVNGSFAAFPSERVDQFVTRVYTAAMDAIAQRYERLPSPPQTGTTTAQPTAEEQAGYPLRNIRLRRITGEEMLVDLQKFRLTGDFKDNPYLKNDDVLIFPIVDRDHDFVSIAGAVAYPARFQFVKGDRLSDAVLFGGGLRSTLDSAGSTVISRLDKSGQVETPVLTSVRENPLLLRGDRIVVDLGENERADYRVTVSGEVYMPGFVPVTKNATTLREVIRKAGGFKPSADLERAELIRGANVFRSLFYSETFEDLMMTRTANIAPEDSMVLFVDNKLRFQRGNGLIDFTKIDSTAEGDFIVRDGDFIFVPERLNLVYVFGQVKTPGYVPFKEGMGYAYYLEKAGGEAETARNEVYLIKGKTRTWKSLDNPDAGGIEAGDFLWVPKTHRRDFDYYLVRIGATAQIVGAIATLIILVKQF
jgi:protein involved in polysaccharide export with SLBB domain